MVVVTLSHYWHLNNPQECWYSEENTFQLHPDALRKEQEVKTYYTLSGVAADQVWMAGDGAEKVWELT
jgi:hypothetical protein